MWDGRALRIADGALRPGTDTELNYVLDDIERGASALGAARLAKAIHAELRKLRGKTGDRGVRQDSMHVLLGATMPAVLVEVGFIDHPIEGVELLAGETRESIARAIADGIAAALPR